MSQLNITLPDGSVRHYEAPTTIAQIAEDAGIAALAIHGRTRSQMYRGAAQYDLITAVKQQSRLPIWANGDITSPQKAAAVLAQTGADAVMIGRGTQGQPWLFADIRHYLQHGTLPPPMPFQAACEIILHHLAAMHRFYGDNAGTRIARKHIGWYLARIPNSQTARQHLNQINHAGEQYDYLANYLAAQAQQYEYWQRDYEAA